MVIKAVTPIHVGAGEAVAEVDQPIIRDSLGIPFIQASGLKGAIKAVLPDNLKKLLGSDPENPVKEPSKVKIYDAYPILVPARSLRGLYCYVSSPHLLKWFLNLRSFLSISNKDGYDFSDVLNQVEEGSALLIHKDMFDLGSISGNFEGKVMFNEEFFTIKEGNIDKLRNFLTDVIGMSDEVDRVAIISDDKIVGIVNKSLIRITRVRLEKEAKRVESGGLWTEEYIPKDTYFLSYVGCYLDDHNNVKDMLNELNGKLLFVGGLETIGRGLVHLKIFGWGRGGRHGG